jgi:hypothetical protein
VHVTVLVPLQEPWLLDAETKDTLAGSVSVTVTPVESEGPPFVAVIM